MLSLAAAGFLLAAGPVRAAPGPAKPAAPTNTATQNKAAKPAAAKSSTARATSQPSRAVARRSQVRRVIGKDGRLTWVLQKPIVVDGIIQKPRVTYLLGRTRQSYTPAPLGEKLVQRVLDSVRKAPF